MNYRSKRKKRPLRYYAVGGYTNPYSGYTANLDTSISPASGFGSGQLGTSQMMPQSSTSIGAFDTGNFDTASYFGGDSAGGGGGGMSAGQYAALATQAAQAVGQFIPTGDKYSRQYNSPTFNVGRQVTNALPYGALAGAVSDLGSTIHQSEAAESNEALASIGAQLEGIDALGSWSKQAEDVKAGRLTKQQAQIASGIHMFSGHDVFANMYRQDMIRKNMDKQRRAMQDANKLNIGRSSGLGGNLTYLDRELQEPGLDPYNLGTSAPMSMKLGGYTKVYGPSHEDGGVPKDLDEDGVIDSELEGGEIIEEMRGGGRVPKKYIWSDHLKKGGMSYAKNFEEMKKKGASKKDIEKLRVEQEVAAGRDPRMLYAKYGGMMKYKAGGAKDFKPHMMYNPKTGKGYKANTYEDHLRMDKMGYGHTEMEEKAMGGMMKYRGGGINIDPAKRGTFKAQASRMGMGVQEAASKILSAPEGRYSPEMRRKANFAKNFAKRDGGMMHYMQEGGPAKKVSEYMDALSRMDQDSVYNPRFPQDTDRAYGSLENIFNLNYNSQDSKNALEAAKKFIRQPMLDQRRIEREEDTVAAKPLTPLELMKRDDVGYYKQPTKMDETGLRPKTPNKYTARQMQLDEDNRNSGMMVYKDGGKLPKEVLESRLESHMSEGEAQDYLDSYKGGGLWANIHAKRKRIAAGSGEKMRKPGSKGAPTEKALRESKRDGGYLEYKKGGFKSPAWTRKEGQNPSGGLNAKGRASAKAEGSNLKAPVSSGTNPRRVSFAARFAGMKGPMKNEKGEPTRKALALKKWGFGSVEAARNFANKNKKSAKYGGLMEYQFGGPGTAGYSAGVLAPNMISYAQQLQNQNLQNMRTPMRGNYSLYNQQTTPAMIKQSQMIASGLQKATGPSASATANQKALAQQNKPKTAKPKTAKPPKNDISGDIRKYAPYALAGAGTLAQLGIAASIDADKDIDPALVSEMAMPEKEFLTRVKDTGKAGREARYRSTLRSIENEVGPQRFALANQANIELTRQDEQAKARIDQANVDIDKAEKVLNTSRADTTRFKNAEIRRVNAESVRNEALRKQESINNKKFAMANILAGAGKDALAYMSAEDYAKAMAGDRGVMNRFYKQSYDSFERKYKKNNPTASPQDIYSAFLQSLE